MAWALALAGTVASNAPSSRAQGGDQTPPTIVARTPGSAATGVSVQSAVSVVFSEPVQPATVVLELRNAGNQLVAGQVAYDGPTQTATLTPDAALVGSQQYTATARSTRDLAGNQMTQVSWSFSTGSAGFVDQTLPQTGLVDPMVIAFDRDDQMYVAEKSGRILRFDDIDDPTGTVVADLRMSVYNFWDRGMLGMALHPNFPTTPYLYVLYAYDAVPGGTAPRWGSSSNPQVGNPCPTPPGATTNGCVVTGRLTRLDIGNVGAWPLNHTNEVPLVTDWFQQFPSHSIGSLAFGSDGALYASGGDGASFNYADYGQTSSSPGVNAGGNNDPTNEGGALRSQDLRTSGDNVTLDGAIIRIDPLTGLALPDNPLYTTQSDQNGKRIISYGYRNPFRFTFRPGTRELWVGDVGWNTWEEINRIVDPTDGTVDNMGWPCYEGNGPMSGYSTFSICQGLYSQGAGAIVTPYFNYSHDQLIVPGETCGTGSSSVTGLAFYGGSGYPASYQGALFFADYSRKCVWAMRKGANGLPDAATVQTITGAAGPVMLATAPDGDVLYAGFDDDRLHRIRYVGGNLPPTAAIAATPSSGLSPLTVSFTAAGSTDPEGQTLTYAWDLDGDGSFDDGTGLTRSWTYTSATATTITARVLVSDTGGQSAVAATPILLNGTRPTAVIDTPTASFQWKVGDPIGFSGRGLDPDEPGGQLPASALQWEVNIHHCPSDCHVHGMQTFNGVSSGSFNAPDHEYPSFLELRLTVTDPTGASDVATVNLQPQTTTLTFNTSPVALNLTVNGAASTAPFSRTVIVGSSNSVNAVSPQIVGSTSYTFNSWSDGQPLLHQITAPATPATYTANYDAGQSTTQTVTFQVAAGSDDANQQAATITTDAATVFLGNANASQVNTTGFRFAGVAIPPGAVVSAATLEVTASATQWSAMSFEVAAEAAVNSATFSDVSGPSSRALLAPRATHSSNEQWVANTWYPASDQLAALVQAVIAQPGWASGNALSLILRGTDAGWARKWAQAFEGSAARAARLVVTYSVPPSGPSISINDVTVTEGNSGTANATFTVTLSAQPGATPVTLNYATSNGTAVAPGDYTATSGSLSFTGTTTTRTISVPIVGDTASEATETFTVTLSGAVGGSIVDATAIGTITNDDAPLPTLTIADTAVAEGNAGTTTASFTVTLSAQPGATPVTVNYATSNGTAVAPGDYSAIASGSLTFSGTTTVQTIPVSVLGDTAVETNETFTVTLSSPVGATLADGVATGTINNDDVPLPSLTIADATVTEGNAGTTSANFTVTLSAQPGATPVTVSYATSNGTAVAPGDYTAITSGSITFSGTTTVQTIPVTVVGDTTVEPAETFTVTLTSPTGATLADGVATGTINNDDVPPPTQEQTVTLQIAGGANDTYESAGAFIADDPSLWIGTGGLPAPGVTGLRFTGVAIPANAFIVSARFEVTPAAAQWNYYSYEAAAEAAISSAPFTDTSRPSQRTLLPPRVAHSSNEQWLVNTWYAPEGDFAPLVQAVVDQPGWSSGGAMGLILRGEAAAWTRKRVLSAEGSATRAPRLIVTYRALPTGPTLSIADVAVFEGNSGTTNAGFVVTLSAQPGASTVTVNYSTGNGTAAAPGDFTAVTNGSLSFTGTTTSQTINIPIVGDTTFEPNETFTVTLSNPVGATILGASATGTITNDDAVPPMLSIADVTQAEGNSGTTNAGFVVTLSAQPGASTVTVNYSTSNGTAAAPGDFTAVTNGSLSFTGTTTSQIVNIPIVGDTTVEPNETFTVTLSNPVGATILDGSATGTITNDDVPLPTLSVADATQAEGNSGTTNLGFVVTLSAQPGASTVTVNYATSNGTAVAPGDFTAVTNGSLSFTGTTTSQTIPIAIVGDTAVESTETFTVTLSTPVGATILDGSATGTITNDDGVPVEQTVTFQIAAGADDVQEEGTGFDPTANTMWVGNGQLPGPYFAGLRFAGVTIPAGAVIVSARLEVTPAATQWNQVAYEAGAEAAAASAPFSTTSRPSQRVLLAPRVLHDTNIQWVNNSWQALDGELAPLLQGVISQAGWASGNPLSLILRGNGPAYSRKRFTTAEGTAGRAPRLVVTYRAVP